MYIVSSGDSKEISASNTTHIVAGVMVIGSLIVGLLFALLIFRKRNGQREYTFNICSNNNELMFDLIFYIYTHISVIVMSEEGSL